MVFQIVSLLLEVVVGLVAGTCLLRLYMQQQGIPLSARYNPLGRFVFALTDWIVLPLRRLLPSMGRLDTASLVAAFLLELAQFALLWLLSGGRGSLVSVVVLALFGVVRLTISGLSGLVLVYAILSWMPSRSPIYDMLERLVTPPLVPIRRALPLIGGIDLSPLVLLLILQVAAIVVGHLQNAVMF
jgi:YggT family protein